MKNKICDYIDSQKDSFVSDLKRLIDIKSVRQLPLPGKPFGEGSAAALAEAEKIAAEHGFYTLNFENYVGEITFGENPTLMLLAHLDVVEEGDGWTYEPYNMKKIGNKVYGRGTTDDKGACLACLYALKAAKYLFGEPKKGVRLVMGCGEETGSEDMEYYFSKREKLDFTLSPDADYPVINLEKGRFAPKFTKRVDNTGQKKVLSFFGGTTGNKVPSKASAEILGLSIEDIVPFADNVHMQTGVLFSFEKKQNSTVIFSMGVSSHAAHPEDGNNAQTALIALINSLNLDENELTLSFRSLGSLFPHKDNYAQALGLNMSDELSGALTLNFGELVYQDDFLRGSLDLRCPICANDKNVKEVIEKALFEHGFAFEGDPEMIDVHYVPEDSPIIKTTLKVYEEYTGNKGECLSIGGGTYVHSIEGGIAFGVEFPGKDYRIHGADEYALIDELLLTAKMYTAVIHELCY